ncbi:DUF4386 domain-containing protein [Winogradskyella immobilis]|uniref:DUF4386 domain-containing protein n=1 Tax=Winogradskyella immobilis TaxID=2816852 RepID=A0ABS8EK01_9FLAO|nr:DUF4386 domain-containing protein [Winogradskyella immobilis]MCC1483534.1 DUF4386 domain-containing protein [Winogradskyella immobilis]MCG0015628.1 DUF4386 domain-containing protein [Winogradskyella immobilis]
MNSYKTSAIAVGMLFIITTLTFMIGDGILQELFSHSNLLPVISDNSSKVVLAVLLQLICGLGVVGIAVIMYPIFKLYNERIAILYVGNRIMECIIIAISGISLLSLLSLSRDHLVISEDAALPFLREYHATFLMLSLVLGFGAFAFYYLLFKSKLVPRLISVWGIIAVILMVIGLVLDMLGYSPQLLLYIPMGLNELFLGFWLIFKGFNTSAFKTKLA